MTLAPGFAPALLAAALIPAPAAAQSERAWDRASTVSRDVLIAAALGLPAVKGDWRGELAAGASVAAAVLAKGALKATFPERRPDGSDRKSFPSGHSSAAAAAAATLQNRYGWKAGLPAQAVAAFVAVARVEANRHHWYDVVAGAALGEASGFLLTRRRDDRVRVVPWAGGGGAGFALAARF